MMKIALLLSVMGLCFCGCQFCPDGGCCDNDGVLIHISHGSDDVHRALMGLQMAAIMSEDKDVLVYFDIKGIEAVLKESAGLTHDHFPGSKAQIETLLSRGVAVLACPGCLKAWGKTEADLLDGITIADKKQLFGFTDGRIITFDY